MSKTRSKPIKARLYEEEVLFEIWSEGWEKNMPVKLITYNDGSQDLHLQTGDHWTTAIEKAREILAERKLQIVNEDGDFIAMSGVYLGLKKID